MVKIFISLLIIASLGGIVASLAQTARPGTFLYSFKIAVTDNVAAALCSVSLPCSK